MDDDKVYRPEEIVENPFPGEPQPIALAGQPNPAGTFTPTTAKEKTFPVKRTAVELLSTALNTRSKKILQEFELQDSGGFKVGDFKSGVSGELKITPNGLTARNKSGITTLAVDGDTGEAIFLGTVRAGSLISDSTIDGGAMNINNNFIVDNEGNVTIGVSSDVATGISPSLLMYNDEGALVGKLEGDTAIAKYLRWNDVALGNTIFYENGVLLSGEIMRVNVDDGLLMFTNKGITLRGTGILSAPADGGAKLYVDQSGGKDRLMVIFNSGAAQQIAIEP